MSELREVVEKLDGKFGRLDSAMAKAFKKTTEHIDNLSRSIEWINKDTVELRKVVEEMKAVQERMNELLAPGKGSLEKPITPVWLPLPDRD